MSDNRSYIYQVELSDQDHNDARVIASSFIKEKSVLLDVGCACGDFGKYIVEKKGVDVYGMEYDALSIKSALEKNIYNRIHQVDLNVHQSNEYPEYFGRFDYITLLDVLEHTVAPDYSLKQLIPYLKKDGYFVVSLPNISFSDIKLSILNDEFEYTDMGILDRTHLRFFTYKTIALFFADASLEIMECKVKVSDVTFNSKNIPSSVKRFILNNPHSYVYQYIFKCRLNESNKELQSKNLEVLNVSFKDFKGELRRIKKNKLINQFLPVGSRRRSFMKSLFKKLKGN